MTEYLGVNNVLACKALTKTLETRSPAFYEDVSINAALEALTYALVCGIESWDECIVYLAKAHRAPIIYSIDEELARKVKEIKVVNPISADTFRKYNEWMGGN
ncbi:MAG: hypothetical protein QXY40_03740 [Candidatus Methanomethylicia archaeon]